MVRVTSFSEAGGHPDNEDAFEVRRFKGPPACRVAVDSRMTSRPSHSRTWTDSWFPSR